MNVADIINACDRKFSSLGLSDLTATERVVVLASRANFEVELGGVGALFHNSTGAISREIVDALIELGAMEEAAAINRGRELLRTHSWQELAQQNYFERLTDKFLAPTPGLFERLTAFVQTHERELVPRQAFQAALGAHMPQEQLCMEWWAEISGPHVHLARLLHGAHGCCEVLDIDGHTHAFGSYEDARSWLLEDEYALVPHLIEEGELPQSFTLPSATDQAELLRQIRDRGPELQDFLDDKFFKSLGVERSAVVCRQPDCTCGAVEGSGMCAKHHFENVMGRPYRGVNNEGEGV